MKLSFIIALLFVNQLGFAVARSFLDGEVQGDVLEEGAATAAVPADFKLPSTRVKQLKAALLPMFKSLPKNRHGNLVPQVARYALHRLFEQQHSWSVNGLRPVRGSNEENVFGELTTDVTPMGISIDNLTFLAAMLEDRIHKETVAQLKTTYGSLSLDTDGGEMSVSELDALVDKYMTIYISGMREYNLTDAELAEQRKYMETSTQDWPATTEWIHNSQQDAMRARKPCGHGIADCTFDFQATTYIVEDLLRGYGQFNHGECKRLKGTLLEMEDRKTGRVSLADFYNKGISGTWEFNEKIDYLRDLGTLDESVPGKPRVIVANYVNSWVNCLTSSSLYSVCCRNECEDLLGHLERNIESATASPERVIQLVQDFHSDDIVEPLRISELLHTRLRTIAEKHGGSVPLHGRLFAQWLHHVLPQSCPYPHAAGATNPLTPDQWMKERGHSAIKASQEEIMQTLSNVAVDVTGRVHSDTDISADDDELGEKSMPWSDVEEVFVIHSPQETHHVAPFLGLDFAVMLAEVAISLSLVFVILRVAKAQRPQKAFNTPFEKVTI